MPHRGSAQRGVNHALRLEAPAKLNLELRVVGRRGDGLHLLESTLVLLDLADVVELRRGSGALRVDGPAAGGVPASRDNLAWRGLTAGFCAEPDHVELLLNKRIPAASGLGGGSSDAAAAWRLARRWRGEMEDPGADEVATLAAIGADVPFFAAALAAARVGGIGEAVAATDVQPAHVVLVHPRFELSTAAVFGELRRDEWGAAPNDLLAAARRLRPEIDELCALVTAAGGSPQLTGSGPTIFARSDDPERAEAVARRLHRAGVAVTLTRTRSAAASIVALSHEHEEDR